MAFGFGRSGRRSGVNGTGVGTGTGGRGFALPGGITLILLIILLVVLFA